MKTLTLILAALTMLAAPPPARAATLDTQVSLLVGFPDADAAAPQGVLVVPGTVIPVSPGPAKRLAGLDREEQASARLTDVAESLKRTLRLARIEVSYRQLFALELDADRELPAPAVSSDVELRLKLLGFDDRSASYEVQFFERSTPIADTRVTVARGERAVVGGLDGEAAPYLFLVLEPRAGDPEAPVARRVAGPLPVSLDDPVDGDLTPPRAVHKVPPAYTEEARTERLQGVVIVQAVIAEDGSVEDVQALKELPMGLTEAAIEAVRQWRFAPATLDGEPIAVYYNLTINFRLTKEGKK